MPDNKKTFSDHNFADTSPTHSSSLWLMKTPTENGYYIFLLPPPPLPPSNQGCQEAGIPYTSNRTQPSGVISKCSPSSPISDYLSLCKTKMYPSSINALPTWQPCFQSLNHAFLKFFLSLLPVMPTGRKEEVAVVPNWARRSSSKNTSLSLQVS